MDKISGEWLALLITNLQGADFDVSLIGFDAPELDDLFKDSLKDRIKDDGFDVDAELQKPAISKLGDTWALGRSPYQWQHEPVLFGWKKKGAHQWYTSRKETTIWEFDKPRKNCNHSMMKPAALLAYPIMNSSMSNIPDCMRADRQVMLQHQAWREVLRCHHKVLHRAGGFLQQGQLPKDGLAYGYDELLASLPKEAS
ncbi:MAG: hypothetical protein PHI83_06720 [Sphaerochaetaceae bacterium]|nr:hypothetical protein [Sphaerochaetaceae bacterium]